MKSPGHERPLGALVAKVIQPPVFFIHCGEGRQVGLVDADQFGNFILDKHKGSTGKFIPWKEMKGR